MNEIFASEFMQRAAIAGLIIGILGSYYGTFIVQRRMSFIGDGLAHAAFGGVALGILLNTEPLLIAIPFTVLVSLSINWLRRGTRLGSDTSIGILFAVSVALGIIFLSLKDHFATDAMNYLFGSILAVTVNDLIIGIILLIITILTFFRYWGRWAYATFDSELAKTDRIKVRKDDTVLSVLIALTVVISIKIVGIVLIASYIIIPAASARLLSKTFYQMTVISIAIGAISSLAGLVLSFILDLPAGAVIILVQALIFIVSLIINKIYYGNK